MNVDQGNMFTGRTQDHRADRSRIQALGHGLLAAVALGLILAVTAVACIQIG